MSSLSLASASSQYARFLNAGSNPYFMGCFFRSTTNANQIVMRCETKPVGTIIRYAELSVGVAGGTTLQPYFTLWSSTGPTVSSVGSTGRVYNSPGLWAYIAGGWFDASSVWVYIVQENGVSYSNSSATTITMTTANRYSIGSDYDGTGTFMDGDIAHACWWTDVLDLPQVEHIANGRFGPPVSSQYTGSANDSLIHHFPLNGRYDSIYGIQKALTAFNSPTFSGQDPNACEPMYQELSL